MAFSTVNIRNVDIEKLNHFYLIYRAKSIIDAARKNEIDVNVLRHSLRTIEKKLNTKLFHAKNKDFSPTPDGLSLYKICEEIVNLFNKFNNSIFQEDKSAVIKQDFIIVASTTLAHFVLPEILLTLSEMHPELSIHVYSGPEYFSNPDFVFDVRYGPKTFEKSFVNRKMQSFKYYLYVNTELKKRLSHIKSVDALKNQDLLIFSGQHLVDKKIIEKNNIKFLSSSYPLLVEMCSRGLGILSIFNIKDLNETYGQFDLVPLFDNYVSEDAEGSFCFSRLNSKQKIIEDFYKIVTNFLENRI